MLVEQGKVSVVLGYLAVFIRNLPFCALYLQYQSMQRLHVSIECVFFRNKGGMKHFLLFWKQHP